MATIPNFDTQDAVKSLKDKGFTDIQADEIVNTIKNSQTNLLTRTDLKFIYIAILLSPWFPEIVKGLAKLINSTTMD